MLMLVMLSGNQLLFAQELRFTASVNKTEVGTGEPFEVSFSVNGNGENFTPPNFSGFQLVSGPNVSNSMTSINGNTTVSISYSYVLLPVKEGVATIGPAYMVINGRRLATSPIRMKVVKGQSVQQGRASSGGGDPDIIKENTEDLSKSIFLKADVDKTTVYQGEQLTLSYRLYTRASIVDSRLDKLPDLNGFWSEDVKTLQQKVEWKTVTYKGLRYNIADVKQTVLFAEHSGDITINPFEMTFIVRLAAAASDDIMEQFFGSYKDVKVALKSKPVVIHVKPLPEAGKPAGFTGAVGNFSVTTTLDKTELKSNETLNYNVKVSGSGNLKLLKTLSLNFPPDFEKYDPKITDTISQHGTGLSGSRMYNYLLIPRHQGNYTIDPIQFSYFNPVSKKYITLPGKAFQVKVNKGLTEQNVTAFSEANKQEVKVLDKDIRYIKTGAVDKEVGGTRFYGSIAYILLLLLGPLLCLAALFYRNWYRKNNSDLLVVKNRRAGKEAAKHLANAQKQLATQQSKAFYEAVFKGLYGYLSDKLLIAMADLNKETITESLQAKSVDEALISRLIATLDLCEMARYAPVTQSSEQEVLAKAKSIINDLENAI
jgi:hypothetical protein